MSSCALHDCTRRQAPDAHHQKLLAQLGTRYNILGDIVTACLMIYLPAVAVLGTSEAGMTPPGDPTATWVPLLVLAMLRLGTEVL